MSRIRQFAVVTGTFSVALGIGFVMQNGDALAARFSETPVQALAVQDGSAVPAMAADAAPQPGTAAYRVRQHLDAGAIGALPQVAVAAPVPSAQHPEPVAVIAALEPDQPGLDIGDMQMPVTEVTPVSLTVVPEQAAPVVNSAPIVLAALETDPVPPAAEPPVAAAPDCTIGLVASPQPAAMVTLVLDAPCSPDMQATIHHQGMMFSIVTDAVGHAQVTVPALAESAVFIVDLDNGAGAVAVTTVPDLAVYDRAVLQWQGPSGPEIHALEFGAGYNDAGHVWNGAARNVDAALSGEGGFLLRLGDGQGLNPLMAEVYTYPSNQSIQAGHVAFTVETTVTADNCGTEIEAQTIQVSPGADPFALDLTMMVPDCDAVGEYLVLKNMLLDLTLAAK